MNKKGQITLFIILGLFILLMAISLLFLSITTTEDELTAEKEKIYEQIPEAGQVKELIDSCLEKSTMRGLLEISSKGGYSNIPPTINYRNRSVWFIDQINVQPTLEEIKIRLEQFIEQDIDHCLNYSTFEEQGFKVVTGEHKSKILFGGSKVVSRLNYTLEFSKGEKIKAFDTFSIDLDFPLRKMFETASTIINLQQKTDFERLAPLKGFNSTLFTVRYSIPDDEHLIYSIIEKESHLKEKISLEFSSEFGKSYLMKTISLKPNSNTIPTNLPMSLRSIDKMLKLFIMPGTTVNLRGAAIANLTMQQVYLGNVTRKGVPISEGLDNSITYGDVSWTLSYPIYELGPSPIRFNDPQTLVLHWDEDEIPLDGEMGLLYEDEDGWRPLPIETDYENNNIWTSIPGWGLGEEFKANENKENIAGSAIDGAITVSFKKPKDKVRITPVACGLQSTKLRSTTAEIDPGGGCIARLIALIVALIITAIIIFVSVGTATGPAFAAWTAQLSIMFGGTATGLVISTTAVVLNFIGIIVGGLVVAAMVNGAVGFDAGVDQISFPVTCNQTVNVTTISDGGTGICTINDKKVSSLTLKGGRRATLGSKMPKCNFGRAMFCIKCSVECKAKYK